MSVLANACDCHMHIFGDPAMYPPATWRAYDPVPLGLDRYDKEAARMGFARVVFVQPSAYGTDNSCMLAALLARGPTSRGVAVIDDATSETTLVVLPAAGTIGVRLNLGGNGIPRPA
ncbi:MAG: amidohydrolase family protein, partial [Acetobacteraceae bacterium]|nr:amidohydrolase family protein [Acetobacteraceae bacterium]